VWQEWSHTIFAGPQFEISNGWASRARLRWQWSGTALNRVYRRYVIADGAMLKQSATKLAALHDSDRGDDGS
jgi:hypothetical protein